MILIPSDALLNYIISKNAETLYKTGFYEMFENFFGWLENHNIPCKWYGYSRKDLLEVNLSSQHCSAFDVHKSSSDTCYKSDLSWLKFIRR